MKVAIPSHNRADMVVTHALRFALVELNVQPCDVFIFVSNEKMLQEYRHKINAPVHLIATNTDNVRDKFNYIHSYWNDGSRILLVEDDLKGLTTITDRSAKKIVKHGFDVMDARRKSIWGIYPSSNKLFMQHSVTDGFAFIVANMYGFVADGDKRILGVEHYKHDYERSILYAIHKGGVIRLNYAAPITNNYTNKGGMQDLSNRAAGEHQSSMNLVKKYPNHVAIKHGTKSKFTEIKFIRNKAND